MMSTKSEQDALRTIYGIGKAFAKALHQIGIHTFADLAVYTPKQLSHELEVQTGLIVKVERIEENDWIGQAKAKLTEQDANDTPDETQEAASAKSLWRQQAGFSFFFDFLLNDQGDKRWRTRFFHEESNEETEIEQINLDHVVQFIREKAAIPFDVAVLSESKADEVIGETAVHITTLDATAELADEPSEHKVVVDVAFEITGNQAASITESRYPFILKLNLVNDTENEVEDELLIESVLEPGVFSYAKQSTFIVPHKIGRYQIQSSILLSEPTPIEVLKPGPIINVTE